MARPKGHKQRRDDLEMPSDDEIDKFHAQKDILKLDGEDSGSEGDGFDSEEEALALQDDSEDFSDEDDDNQLAKVAKKLRAKVRIEAGEGEEGEEDEEGEEGGRGKGAWGANKRAYYGADTGDLEGSEAEEDAADEEEEALRLQREAAAGLRPEDFGLSASESEESEEEGGSGDEEGAGRAGFAVEEVQKDLSGLSEEQKRAAVEASAQELGALIGELRASLAEVRSRVGPLLREVQDGELATSEGVSYLEAKHLLLLNYCTSLVFYLLLKAEGRPVRDHPVIARLVEIRAYLDKIRPIDKKLQYQLDKLLAAAQKAKGEGEAGPAAGAAGADMTAEEAGVFGAAGGEDPLSYGPRPEALVPKVAAGGAAEAAAAGGVYRPPKLNPVSMELEGEGAGPSARERRETQRMQRRAQRSTYVQELAAELAGAPEEERLAPVGLDTAAALRERQRLAARDDVEEELMIRVPMSKEERKRLRSARRSGLSGGALLDDFADDIADIVGAGDEGAGVDGAFARHRASQKFGADLAAQAAAAARKAPRSGDADLPSRAPLHERRAKYDAVRAAQGAAGGFGSDEDMPEEMGGGRDTRGGKRGRYEAGEEDEFYQQAKAAAAGKKARRKEAYTYPETLPPAEDPTTTDARKITRDIEKNRGLTPHRRKDLKNPRKKNRVKFAKATVRRKGQVQEVKAGAAGGYGGESTGIKARVSKSVRL